MKNMDLNNLLSQMTIDEKIGQLVQFVRAFYSDDKNGEITGPLNELNITEDVIWNSGSVLGSDNAEDMIEIQKRYLEKNRLKIPLLFMADVIHGFRTVFPIPLAIGCTWDMELAKKSAEIAAKEAALSGTNVTFSPMVDLVRDPRWGRVIETTGEDPYLNGLFATAFVQGYQGNMTDEYNIAACVKHFAGYGASEAGREYNTVDMSERNLRENYLPSYKAAVDAGVELVMTSFNTVNGIPSTGNSYLMRDILRKEWGFKGIVISDWAAVQELIPHGVAKDGKEAAKKAIEAGVDIEMMTSNYVNNLRELIEKEKIKMELLDEAALRILELKNKLGLFENPYRTANAQKAEEAYLCKEHREIAREVAYKSFVLLKNNNILPFSKEKNVAIIGPFAKNNRILGPWSVQGKEEEAVNFLEGIQNKIGREKVVTVEGGG
ncbi:glycoside hydrolase family 3 protein [Clostridium saccharoperbutylacetonicum]|nr:glycoside hydrolase family 3 N-terminal domain-containing protein [Clostridium saccharoperbutylacetonicum]NRT59841.1 beta-glucosidase-like glycosyl hydrolase [Clostridium saccharoperbutylacetonicum]NSB23153.1 beta-glucosidase-like glycosyl hydrolase [Clostridium saccharoperbutylacetonicum]